MTAEELLEKTKQILNYNPETGDFTYIQKRKRMNIGDKAGALNKAGYIQLNLFGKVYAAHRVAFLYMIGSWPVGVVDHKDTNTSNNKWSNLRDVTKTVNNRNKNIQKNNKSGVTGVSWNTREKRWVATICVESKSLCLGYFKFFEDAVLARMTAEKENGYWLDKVWDQL